MPREDPLERLPQPEWQPYEDIIGASTSRLVCPVHRCQTKQVPLWPDGSKLVCAGVVGSRARGDPCAAAATAWRAHGGAGETPGAAGPRRPHIVSHPSSNSKKPMGDEMTRRGVSQGLCVGRRRRRGPAGGGAQRYGNLPLVVMAKSEPTLRECKLYPRARVCCRASRPALRPGACLADDADADPYEYVPLQLGPD
jgi:hypothetical protein